MTNKRQDYLSIEESSPILPTLTTHSATSTATVSLKDQQKVEHAVCSVSISDSQHENNQDEDEEDEDEEPEKLTRMERFKEFMKLISPLLIMLLIDAALPLALYYLLKQWLSQLAALIISGVPPLLNVLYTFWKRRHIDVLGCIFVLSFVLSAVLSIISGDIRLAMLRDSTVTAVISLMFLLTLIPLRTKWFTIRPLIFLISQQMLAGSAPVKWTDANGEKHELERMEWVWQNCSFFRKYCYILCAAWGVLLMSEFVAKVIMIESTLSVDEIVLYGNIIMIVIVTSNTVGSVIASKIMSKKIRAVAQVWRKENDFTVKKKKNKQAEV